MKTGPSLVRLGLISIILLYAAFSFDAGIYYLLSHFPPLSRNEILAGKKIKNGADFKDKKAPA